MKHLVVVSIDAMITEDIPFFRALPNMGKLLEHASVVERALPVYPTYTYPCHASIVTGCWPDKHGIYHNDVFDPHSPTDKWFWYADALKVETLFDVAKAAGLSTASVCFPVQGAAAGVDYLIPEIWAEHRDDDPTEIFRTATSPAAWPIFEKHKSKLNWMKTPEFDYFATDCACDIIRQAKVNIIAVHLSYLDHQRHRLGVLDDGLSVARSFIDDRIGEIVKAVEDAGIAEDTDYILLGDHGQMNVSDVFNINALLAQRGYIKLDGEGRVSDYTMMVHSASFSGQVYTKGISDSEAREVLLSLREEFPQYIERVMSRADAKEFYKLDGPFSFVLEAQSHVIFGSALTGDLVSHPEVGNYKYSLSTHGYSPEKSYRPPFILAGPHASGLVVENARLIDEAPTILSFFGLAFEAADGTVIEGLVKD